MNFFEYQVTIAKIDQTNSYNSLRKLHKKLVGEKLDDSFYAIHAINKTIKKFKDLNTSHRIKNKSYPAGTSSHHFNLAIQSATTKEQILLLLADFQGDKYITLPTDTESVLHMEDLGIQFSDIHTIHIKAHYYSVGYDPNDYLSEINRLPLAIMNYLEPINHTQLYTDILTTTLDKWKRWNSTPQSIANLSKSMQTQIDKQEDNINTLKQALTLLKEITDDTTGNIPTT